MTARSPNVCKLTRIIPSFQIALVSRVRSLPVGYRARKMTVRSPNVRKLTWSKPAVLGSRQSPEREAYPYDTERGISRIAPVSRVRSLPVGYRARKTTVRSPNKNTI